MSHDIHCLGVEVIILQVFHLICRCGKIWESPRNGDVPHDFHKEISAWKRWEGSKVKPQTTNIGPVLVVSIQFWRCASLTQIQQRWKLCLEGQAFNIKIGSSGDFTDENGPPIFSTYALCLFDV